MKVRDRKSSAKFQNMLTKVDGRFREYYQTFLLRITDDLEQIKQIHHCHCYSDAPIDGVMVAI